MQPDTALMCQFLALKRADTAPLWVDLFLAYAYSWRTSLPCHFFN